VAPLILLDTHVVAWLYAGDLERVPAAVRAEIDGADAVGASPVVALELQHLHEIERLNEPASKVVGTLERSIGLHQVDASLNEVIGRAIDLAWTRDPFDRLIAAHSATLGAPLATADQTLLSNVELAFWNQ
jgi:PIN domain nuclease of toxin-antitoxin system